MAGERVAIITGAGSGIGRAAAIALDRTGHELVLLGRRTNRLEETAGLLQHDRSLIIATDISNPCDVSAAFTRIIEQYDRVDLLFNNAGIGTSAVTIDELDVDEWNRCIAVNLTGTFLCSREAFRIMRRQVPGGGRIINNGSVSAHSPRPKTIAYTASKHAITGLTKSLSLDGRRYGISCSQIDIGNAGTRLTSTFGSGTEQGTGQIAPEPVFDVSSCGDAVAYIAGLPADANILFMTIMATRMPFVGRG